MLVEDITETQCWKIEALLLKGQSWTRQAWIDHFLFTGRRPRIIAMRYHWLEHGVDKYQDQFVQIWDGLGSGLADEPCLHSFRYKPCDEDYAATDWLQVDRYGNVISL